MELVREKKPACIVGRPQSRAVGHIRFICGLYQLQVREGSWFVHEQPRDSITWKMKEVVGLKEVEGVFDTDQWDIFVFYVSTTNYKLEKGGGSCMSSWKVP